LLGRIILLILKWAVSLKVGKCGDLFGDLR